jgi:hypothetical protein
MPPCKISTCFDLLRGSTLEISGAGKKFSVEIGGAKILSESRAKKVALES